VLRPFIPELSITFPIIGQDANPLGQFDTLTTTVRLVDSKKSKDKHSVCFELVALGSTYTMMHVDDERETMEWFEVIKNVSNNIIMPCIDVV
jgi:hypothetical protein